MQFIYSPNYDIDAYLFFGASPQEINKKHISKNNSIFYALSDISDNLENPTLIYPGSINKIEEELQNSLNFMNKLYRKKFDLNQTKLAFPTQFSQEYSSFKLIKQFSTNEKNISLVSLAANHYYTLIQDLKQAKILPTEFLEFQKKILNNFTKQTEPLTHKIYNSATNFYNSRVA